MSLYDELRADSIDVDKFIAFQYEFIIHCRKYLEGSMGQLSYLEFLERDQVIDMAERFINRLEREQLQIKIQEMSNRSLL